MVPNRPQGPSLLVLGPTLLPALAAAPAATGALFVPSPLFLLSSLVFSPLIALRLPLSLTSVQSQFGNEPAFCHSLSISLSPSLSPQNRMSLSFQKGLILSLKVSKVGKLRIAYFFPAQVGRNQFVSTNFTRLHMQIRKSTSNTT